MAAHARRLFMSLGSEAEFENASHVPDECDEVPYSARPLIRKDVQYSDSAGTLMQACGTSSWDRQDGLPAPFRRIAGAGDRRRECLPATAKMLMVVTLVLGVYGCTSLVQSERSSKTLVSTGKGGPDVLALHDADAKAVIMTPLAAGKSLHEMSRAELITRLKSLRGIEVTTTTTTATSVTEDPLETLSRSELIVLINTHLKALEARHNNGSTDATEGPSSRDPSGDEAFEGLEKQGTEKRASTTATSTKTEDESKSKKSMKTMRTSSTVVSTPREDDSSSRRSAKLGQTTITATSTPQEDDGSSRRSARTGQTTITATSTLQEDELGAKRSARTNRISSTATSTQPEESLPANVTEADSSGTVTTTASTPESQPAKVAEAESSITATTTASTLESQLANVAEAESSITATTTASTPESQPAKVAEAESPITATTTTSTPESQFANVAEAESPITATTTVSTPASQPANVVEAENSSAATTTASTPESQPANVGEAENWSTATTTAWTPDRLQNLSRSQLIDRIAMRLEELKKKKKKGNLSAHKLDVSSFAVGTISSSVDGVLDEHSHASTGHSGSASRGRSSSSADVLGTKEVGAACVANGESCLESRCCAMRGMRCYRKDGWWASCNETCSPMRDWDKGLGAWKTAHKKAWDCEVLSRKSSGNASAVAPTRIAHNSTGGAEKAGNASTQDSGDDPRSYMRG